MLLEKLKILENLLSDEFPETQDRVIVSTIINHVQCTNCYIDRRRN